MRRWITISGSNSRCTHYTTIRIRPHPPIPKYTSQTDRHTDTHRDTHRGTQTHTHTSWWALWKITKSMNSSWRHLWETLRLVFVLYMKQAKSIGTSTSIVSSSQVLHQHQPHRNFKLVYKFICVLNNPTNKTGDYYGAEGILAPELNQPGIPRPPTSKSDVWAFGFCLCRIMTGGLRPKMHALHLMYNDVAVRFSGRLSEVLRMCLESRARSRKESIRIWTRASSEWSRKLKDGSRFVEFAT